MNVVEKVSRNMTCIRDATVGSAMTRPPKASHAWVHHHSSTDSIDPIGPRAQHKWLASLVVLFVALSIVVLVASLLLLSMTHFSGL